MAGNGTDWDATILVLGRSGVERRRHGLGLPEALVGDASMLFQPSMGQLRRDRSRGPPPDDFLGAVFSDKKDLSDKDRFLWNAAHKRVVARAR